MLHLRVGLVLTALGLMVACGDDDDDAADDSTRTSDAAVGAAGSGKAGSGGVMLRDGGMGTVSAGSGGSAMTGTIQEGMPCDIANPCAADLACVGIGIQSFSVCARPCQPANAATACEEGEVCGGYTNLTKDNHCLNLVDKEWEFCGPAETADCADPLTCILVPDDETTPEIEVIAICVQECVPNADADADAGLAGLEMSTCAEGQVCLPSELCANLVERGGECSLGHFCEDEADQCLPDRTTDLANATYRCQQDCSAPGTVCEAGECVTLSDPSGAMASFCLDEN
jgi:hypothetical protein